MSDFVSERMCDSALGMQNGRIKNAAITASSQWDKNHAPYLARLGRLRRGRLMGAWSAKRNNHNQFIQVDLLRSMKITGVATQGRAEAAQWVTAFYFLYSSDGVKFAKVKHWWDVVKVGICPGGGLPYKKDGGAPRTFQGLKKTVLVPLRMFSLKRSTAGAFAVHFRVLSRK